MRLRNAGKCKRAGACVVVAATAAIVLAAGGSLDTSFGTGGLVTLSASGVLGDMFRGIAIQPDGKIVAVGKYVPSAGGNSKWLVARFDDAGALDATFAAPKGYLTLFGTSGSDMAGRLVIDPSGRIDVCGGVTQTSGDSDFGVVRLNADGSFDTSFGTGGVVTTNLQSVAGKKKGTFTLSLDRAMSLIVDADGKIVVGGDSRLGNTHSAAVARYNPNGTLDAAFGADGVVFHGVPLNSGYGEIAADGAGGYVCLASATTASLVRFAHDGTYDTAFGQRDIGADFGGGGQMSRLAVQSDGRILVSGFRSLVTPPAPCYAMIVRYLPGGAPDRAYGQNGEAIAGGAASSGTGLALQPDGKAVLGFFSTSGGVTQGSVARFDAAGVLDATFGTGGIGDTVAGFSNSAAALDSLGRIVLAGKNMTVGRPALVRHLGN